MGYILILSYILSYVLVFLLGFYISRMVQKCGGRFLINYADPMKNLVSIELDDDLYAIENRGYLLLNVRTEGVRPKLEEITLDENQTKAGNKHDVD